MQKVHQDGLKELLQKTREEIEVCFLVFCSRRFIILQLSFFVTHLHEQTVIDLFACTMLFIFKLKQMLWKLNVDSLNKSTIILNDYKHLNCFH